MATFRCYGRAIRPQTVSLKTRPPRRVRQLHSAFASSWQFHPVVRRDRRLESKRLFWFRASGSSEETVLSSSNEMFQELLRKNAKGSVSLQPTTFAGSALFCDNKHKNEENILTVPLDICLLVEYEDNLGNIKLPDGEWPRLKKALSKQQALPWDVIQALALLDSFAGSGNDFWNVYAKEIMPDPLHLSLPICLPREYLEKLEDETIIQAAIKQKERLASLFPGLSKPISENGPSWLEWAFSCVRSRAFALGPNIFAFIPFLDIINHSQEPNSDFRLSSDKRSVELYAMSDITEGSQLSISYSDKSGYTNRRFMQQYGFVPRNGNYADRLELPYLETTQNMVKLSLEALQASLGNDDEMVAAFSGRNIYAYAALKSLPIAMSQTDEVPTLLQQREEAKRLVESIHDIKSNWKTTLEQDERELTAVENLLQHGTGDSRLEAVLRYNIHRKKLTNEMERLLIQFID